MEKVEVMDFHQTIIHKGVRVTASPAGHVLGAAMFLVEIDSARVLYTGDYSVSPILFSVMVHDSWLIDGSGSPSSSWVSSCEQRTT
jgi:hypothetical protein